MRLGFAPQTSDNSQLAGIGQDVLSRELLVVCSVVNGLSFAFEYLLGTCLQVMLIAYGWVRGLHFRRARVLQFAVRRMGFVLKWALVIVLATVALVHLPLFSRHGLLAIRLAGGP